MTLYKYQGAGNDFLLVDNREGKISFSKDEISSLCDRRYGVGADGLMLLESSEKYDFKMVYYNSDGSGGMMCGNGGRCIVAFAKDLGYENFDFEAVDGFHTAEVISENKKEKIVRLKMKDVTKWRHLASINVEYPVEGYFLDTGTRHFVSFVEDISEAKVVEIGKAIRYANEFAPIGVNANFVEASENLLKVRTYEKGVEGETFACGTGIVASSIVAHIKGVKPSESLEDGRIKYLVRAKRDELSVDFIPLENKVKDVYLTGPAVYIGKIMIN